MDIELTKYEHACLLINKAGNKLLIDPGCYGRLPDDLDGIGAVVITHEHPDHFDLSQIRSVLESNPDLAIFSTQSVASILESSRINCQAVSSETIDSGRFRLHFNEVEHSIIYRTSPCRNLSVGVDDFLYYPGDSFFDDGRQYELLALPASGPWFSLSQAIDLANSCQVSQIFATHDIHISQTGYQSFQDWIGRYMATDKSLIRPEIGQALGFRL